MGSGKRTLASLSSLEGASGGREGRAPKGGRRRGWEENPPKSDESDIYLDHLMNLMIVLAGLPYAAIHHVQPGHLGCQTHRSEDENKDLRQVCLKPFSIYSAGVYKCD